MIKLQKIKNNKIKKNKILNHLRNKNHSSGQKRVVINQN